MKFYFKEMFNLFLMQYLLYNSQSGIKIVLIIYLWHFCYYMFDKCTFGISDLYYIILVK